MKNKESNTGLSNTTNWNFPSYEFAVENPRLLGFMIQILTLLFFTNNIFTNIETKYRVVQKERMFFK